MTVEDTDINGPHWNVCRMYAAALIWNCEFHTQATQGYILLPLAQHAIINDEPNGCPSKLYSLHKECEVYVIAARSPSQTYVT